MVSSILSKIWTRTLNKSGKDNRTKPQYESRTIPGPIRTRSTNPGSIPVEENQSLPVSACHHCLNSNRTVARIYPDWQPDPGTPITRTHTSDSVPSPLPVPSCRSDPAILPNFPQSPFFRDIPFSMRLLWIFNQITLD